MSWASTLLNVEYVDLVYLGRIMIVKIWKL